VLLVPSLWAEARSRIVVEAMARGVPVIASNVGGIPEAKLGVDYLIPVRPIERYKPSVDENMVPAAEVPPQDIDPWHSALERLTSDRPHYDSLSAESRRVALDYTHDLSVLPFERYLQEVVAAPKRAALSDPSSRPALSADRRKLLALRLRKSAEARRDPAALWFPGLTREESHKPVLFCFPYAGGGTFAYEAWREVLSPHVALCAVRLPGREDRRTEKPFDRMQDLIGALGPRIHAYMDRPVAFFGHSMGAAIAFELARWLRREGNQLPRALFVSAARAPQFRDGWQPPPEPSESEFLEQLRTLEGVPAEVLEDTELMRIVLPALRADARLYRNYVYSREYPLPMPVFAYGGTEDPNVRPEHLEAWTEQTTGRFVRREFAGGHFFIQSVQKQLLKALSEDLQSLHAGVTGAS
ncbi:MAG: alpha/beta fold hydrolase, partial [Bryobacteraceae bacterium]